MQGLFLRLRADMRRWADSLWWFGVPAAACGFLCFLILQGAGERYWGAVDSDLTNQFYPWQVFIHRWFSRGIFPFWDPHVFSGYPTVETQQMLALNPVHLASLLMQPEWGLAFQMAAYTVVAGMGMTAALRVWGGRSAMAASLGGVLYVMSGLLTVRVIAGHFTVVAAMAWWPLAVMSLGAAVRRMNGAEGAATGRLAVGKAGAEPQQSKFSGLRWLGLVAPGVRALAVERLSTLGRPSAVWGLSAVFHAMVLLAGGPQYVVYLFYIDAAMVLAMAPWRRLGRAVAAAGAVWALAAALSAPQWLPALWYLPYTGRALSSGAMGRIDLNPLLNLWLEFIMPFPFGDDVTAAHLHFKNVWETATYPGVVAIVLLLAGLLQMVWLGVGAAFLAVGKSGSRAAAVQNDEVRAVARRRGNWWKGPWRGLARLGFDPLSFAAFLMLGVGAYMMVGGWLPGFGGFREPTKARAVIAFALPLYCAAAVDGILRRPGAWRWALVGGIVLQLGMLWLAGRYWDPTRFVELLREFGTPMDPRAVARYEAVMAYPDGAVMDYTIAWYTAAGLLLLLLPAALLVRHWPRAAAVGLCAIAAGDLLVSHGGGWRARHAWAQVAGVPAHVEDYFLPKLAGVNKGEELPWRVVLNPGIINRTHHYDGFYEFYGYDPLMPAYAVGRNRIAGAAKIQEPGNYGWRIPLLERTGNRYDASRWTGGGEGLRARKSTREPQVLVVPGATLFDVTRHVTARWIGEGMFGPDLTGLHYVLEDGKVFSRSGEPPVVDRGFAEKIEATFPPKQTFATSAPSTLRAGEWIKPSPLKRPDEWKVRVKLDAPALVVFKTTWLPGWRVLIEDKNPTTLFASKKAPPTATLFANNWMTAAIVPAGEHDVTFVYRPVGWHASLVICAAGWLMVLMGCAGRIGARRHPEGTSARGQSGDKSPQST